MAQLSREIKANHEITEEIVHTGQHYDANMSEIFFEELEIPKPNVNLGISVAKHGESTAKMIAGIENEILARKPDLVLLYGDTNSTLAGALAAVKLQIPIAHVEAGERCYDKRVPEEVNRLITDHLSRFKFCVSDKSKKQLEKEGITKDIFVTGDLMFDAYKHYSAKAKWPERLEKQEGFLLATIHRAGNTDSPEKLKRILNYLSQLEYKVLLPIHPRTSKSITDNSLSVAKNVTIVPPVSYFEMLALLNSSACVATDSGGLQREAYYARKKCIVLREETEWTELLQTGACRLMGDSPKDDKKWLATPMRFESNLFGDGSAAKVILKVLINETN